MIFNFANATTADPTAAATAAAPAAAAAAGGATNFSVCESPLIWYPSALNVTGG